MNNMEITKMRKYVLISWNVSKHRKEWKCNSPLIAYYLLRLHVIYFILFIFQRENNMLGVPACFKILHWFPALPSRFFAKSYISIHSRIQSLTLDQGWTNAGHLVTWTTIFCIVVPNNFSIITAVFFPPYI